MRILMTIIMGLFATNTFGFSSYHIGNSLTFDSLGNSSSNIQNGPYGIESIADFYGIDLEMSMHVDSSQALHSIWNNPMGKGGIDAKRTPYNDFTNALTNYQWDALTLEPYLSQGATLGSDKEAISNFITLANEANSVKTFYVYQVWPRQSWGNYTEYWNLNTEYTDNITTRPTKKYYESLMNWAHSTYTTQGIPVLEIPTGEVWNNINLGIESGYITEITMADMYRDDLHASGPIGRYVAAATVFSTMTKTNITDLIPPSQFSPVYLAPPLYSKLNEIIWKTVQDHYFSGISDKNNDGWVDSDDLSVIMEGEANGREFLAWQRNYRAAPTFNSVPEPNTLILSILLTGVLYASRR